MTAFLETGVLGQSAFRSGCAEQSSEMTVGGSGSPVREQCSSVRSSPPDKQDHRCGKEMGAGVEKRGERECNNMRRRQRGRQEGSRCIGGWERGKEGGGLQDRREPGARPRRRKCCRLFCTVPYFILSKHSLNKSSWIDLSPCSGQSYGCVGTDTTGSHVLATFPTEFPPPSLMHCRYLVAVDQT